MLKERPLPSAVEAARGPASTGTNGRGTTREGDEIFGRLIAVRRAALGLSQEDLAARMGKSQANIARIENGRPPSREILESLAVALAAEPGRDSVWSSLRGRWRWGGLAIAILVPALLIMNGRSGETDGGASSELLPEAARPAPTAPAHVLQVDAHGKPLALSKSGKEAKAHKTKDPTSPDERPHSTGEEPSGSAPKATLGPTSPTQPAPKPPSGAAPSQPAGSGSPSAPLQPTGKPDGSAGNGPGGTGGSGGGGVPGGGNGPGGTGPPGQLP
jgi:transcriptional regulator with XRE-family HTH domain